MGWMDTVEVGTDIKMDEAAFVRDPTRNIRFWMPKGSEKTVVFLSPDAELAYWEHAMKIGDDFRNYATCLTHLRLDCPLCALEGKVQKYKAIPFSLIDRSEFTLKSGDKKGTVVKDSKRLYVIKAGAWEKLARRVAKLKEDGKSLFLAEFRIFRSKADKSPSTGDDFEYIRHVPETDFEDVKVYPYADILAPNPELVLKYISKMKSLAAMAATSGPVAGKEDDDLPF
jgi:hypothetical protein